jgi:hypothetical protein
MLLYHWNLFASLCDCVTSTSCFREIICVVLRLSCVLAVISFPHTQPIHSLVISTSILFFIAQVQVFLSSLHYLTESYQTHQPPMAASLAGLSASVTRILYLTGFPKELKTKDIQAAFSDYDGQNGGFKIKWRDDTSLLIVFQDAAVGQFLNLSLFKTCSNSPSQPSAHICAPLHSLPPS